MNHSPSSILSNGAAKITNKILIDHTKQTNSNLILSPSSSSSTTIKNEQNDSSPSTFHPNLLQSSLMSSPRSAFSRTSKTSNHSPDQRRIPKGNFFFILIELIQIKIFSFFFSS